MVLGVGKVMVVDDEEAIRGALQQALEEARHNVVTAASGQEALDMLSGQEPEVLLLDIGMPGLSGLEVLKAVCVSHPDVSVIMVTAINDVQIAVDAMKAGAYDYVTKPVNLDDLLLRLQKAIERRRLVLREREFQRDLNRRLGEQADQLQEQFCVLIQGLAREHAMSLELEALRRAKEEKGLFSKLPPELRQPKASVLEFAEALFTAVRQEGILGKMLSAQMDYKMP